MRSVTSLARPSRGMDCSYGVLDSRIRRDIVARAPMMNAETTAEHLNQILEALPELPIVFFWDMAP